jgi:hypothetical protein
MTIPESIKQFSQWLESFEFQLLQTRDDVRKKFVLPMFQHLGYPDNFCRDKYILKNNQFGVLEHTLIYFSTDYLEKQDVDTSLIFAQWEEPQTPDLDAAIAQAKIYNNYLKTVFFIVTDGYNIRVFQYLNSPWEELIFDINIENLKTRNILTEFYQKLNFNFVKSIDKNQGNFLSHTKYNSIEKSLKHHRDFRDFLAKTDFQPATIREDNRLIVIKPKVAIECNLPQAFAEGDCQIEFSSLIFRGLKICLNHQFILGKLMTGLNTLPHWGCRCFFQQIDTNIFEVYLGQITLILSELEITDLCLCIDQICQEYQNLIIEFENDLETWNFEFIEFAGIRGFYLFSVEQKLWELMQKFAEEFNYTQGKSAWHIFHQDNISIRISRGIRDHAFILPKFVNSWCLLPNNTINIIYEINDVHLQSLERGKVNSWQQDIGPRGTWTAKYTQKWLLEKYIPQVINYYSQETELSEAELLAQITNYQFEPVPIQQINDIINLLPYLRKIQLWLHSYEANLAASLLRGYYKAFTDLVRNTDSAIMGMDYIRGTLQGVESRNTLEEISNSGLDWTFKDALHCLDAQVKRINNCEYESSLKADLITRTFIWMIEHGKIAFSQSQMNAAKLALLPLWELSRFEMRHVYPYR